MPQTSTRIKYSVTLWTIVCVCAVSCRARNWHIDNLDNYNARCGKESDVCSTLENALKQIADNDVIYLHKKQILLCGTSTFVLEANVSILGDDVSTIVGCNTSQTIVNIATNKPARIVLSKVKLKNVEIRTRNFSLSVEDCSLHEATITAISLNPATVQVYSSRWTGVTDCSEGDACVSKSFLRVFGLVSQIHISSCFFAQTSIRIQLSMESKISFNNSIVTNDPLQKPMLSMLSITPAYEARNTTIHIAHSILEKQYNWSPVEAVMNLNDAVVTISRFPPSLNTSLPSSNLHVFIDSVTFKDNERAVTIKGGIPNVSVRNSTFISNVAMHAGAGIVLLTGGNLTIENCTFRDNAAGFYRFTNVKPPGDHFKVRGDAVDAYSNCCKGSITLIGKGGAIRVQKGRADIIRSNFFNNSARALGGSVFVDRAQILKIRNSTFKNSFDRKLAPEQGEIIYSSGKVELSGANITVVSADSHVSILQHSGEHWSISVLKLYIECPAGYRLRAMNTSAYKVIAETGLKKSYMVDQLSYFCESCPRYKYSIQQGSLYYHLNEGAEDYFTLLINGTKPNSIFHGTYLYQDITCTDCPFGADCQHNTVRSLTNFWGYPFQFGLKFQQCPHGYCCRKPPCPGPSSCAVHRTGRLCGHCKKGFSEALFSAQCVPNNTCGPVWIWFFFFGIGALYAILLFFQRDIRNYIFSTPALLYKNWCCCSRPLEANLSERTSTSGSPHETEIILLKENNQSSSVKTQAEQAKTTQPVQTDFGAILLIIILYYFQDAMLFDIRLPSDTPDSPSKTVLKKILLGLFKFRIDVAHLISNVCLIQGLTSWQKSLAKAVLVPYILILFGIVYACYLIKLRCSSFKSSARDGQVQNKQLFSSKLATAFTLALLFLYQSLATTCFSLLNCVDVGYNSVLFVDGNVTCYTGWQYGIISYVLLSVIPFSVVLMLGPGLLKDGSTSLPTFFLACLLPLPFVIYWTFLRLCKQNTGESQVLPLHTQEVVKVLLGPFRVMKIHGGGELCWSGIQVLRRLILILMFTFINHPVVRVLSMLMVCFVILLQQIYIKPYKNNQVNVAGTVSVSALIFVGSINLVRAAFVSAEYTPLGPNIILIHVLKETENVLMLWIPLGVMTLIFMMLFCKTLFVIFKKCSGLLN